MLRLVLVLVLVLGPAARAQQGAPSAAIVVEVNGQPITRSDLDEALALDDDWRALQLRGASAAAQELRRRIEQRVLDDLIDEILMLDAARAQKIALTPEEEREAGRRFEDAVKKKWGSVDALAEALRASGLDIEKVRARQRNQWLRRKLIQEEIGRGSLVRPLEIREYYEANKEAYREPGGIELSQIVVRKPGRPEAEARARIEAARAALLSGKSFAEVARDYPDGANYETGGQLRVEKREALRRELQDALAALREGETSEVLETRDAYLIVRLDRVTVERFKRFEDVQDEIYGLLEKRMREERYEQLRKRLRDRAFIKRK